MIYQTRYEKGEYGFTLAEIIIVLGVFSLFAAISVSLYSNFKYGSNLDIAVANVVEAMRKAQANAEQGQDDSQWGVMIAGSELVIFEGPSYVGRNITSDIPMSLPAGAMASGYSEFVFQENTGYPVNTGTVTVSDREINKDISINEKGTISY